MEKYHAITPAYYRTMNAFIFMYSADNPESFHKIETAWEPNIKEQTVNPVRVLV